ncbi:hypothetical protein T492DRAFT_834744 [Pavlovales sp. CCMP2436]|nr:hypothetical protein T492DRAFT_834744 [Pavlovales sp. CCMP2436]
MPRSPTNGTSTYLPVVPSSRSPLKKALKPSYAGHVVESLGHLIERIQLVFAVRGGRALERGKLHGRVPSGPAPHCPRDAAQKKICNGCNKTDMSQINGSGQGSRQLAMRQRFPTLDGYADETNGRTTVTEGAGDFNRYESNPAFGAYSQAAEELRDFYDTVDAVAQRPVPGEGMNAVQRVANISEREIQLMAQSKDVERSKKWEQYWWSTADPSKSWTITELNKIDPAMVQRKFDAIQEVSQFALDKAIIKHLGHSGDPHLAQLQYMMDQGQMDHMPQTVLVDSTPYQRGPLSVFGFADSDEKSRFADGINLPRQSLRSNVAAGDMSRILLGTTNTVAPAENQRNLFESSGQRIARRAAAGAPGAAPPPAGSRPILG